MDPDPPPEKDGTLPAPSQQPAAEPEESEDDRRAAAAAVNRKRALAEWEANKRLWRDTGIPQGLPAKK